MAKITNTENEVAAGVPEMKYPLMTDISKLVFGKIRKEKVVSRDTKTGKVYGSRVIFQNTSESLIQSLMEVAATAKEELDLPYDESKPLPEITYSHIRTNIRKGARDLEQKWESAIEITTKAYEVSNIPTPNPTQKSQWRQYETLIQFAVKQLAATRGLDGEWRISDKSVHDHTR